MVKGSPRREFSSSRFVEDFGILGILWGKFLFHSFGSLGQGSRERELSDVGVVFLLQFFFLIVPSCSSSILDVYLLGEVDVSTPIPLIFSFALHLLFVSLTFPWT